MHTNVWYVIKTVGGIFSHYGTVRCIWRWRNDIEMLQYCGHSYAMENAPANVKSAAKYVCPSNEEDGVLVTLEKILG